MRTKANSIRQHKFFLSEVKKYLDDIENSISGLNIRVLRKTITIKEPCYPSDSVRKYSTSKLILKYRFQGSIKEIVFMPISSMVVGAKGRIDVITPVGTFMLLLKKKNTWHVNMWNQ